MPEQEYTRTVIQFVRLVEVKCYFCTIDPKWHSRSYSEGDEVPEGWTIGECGFCQGKGDIVLWRDEAKKIAYTGDCGRCDGGKVIEPPLPYFGCWKCHGAGKYPVMLRGEVPVAIRAEFADAMTGASLPAVAFVIGRGDISETVGDQWEKKIADEIIAAYLGGMLPDALRERITETPCKGD